MRIRMAVVEDAEAVAAILRAAFGEFEALYTAAAFAATTPDAGILAARLREGPTWIATSDGRAVGTVSGMVRGDDILVRSMGVRPEARGRGVAAALLEEATAFAVSQGAKRLTLTSTPFLLDAIRLYERVGFRPLPERRDLHGTVLIPMVKILDRPGLPPAQR